MKIITDEERLKKVADERVHREYEVNDYQNNINRFTSMLTTLPTDDLPNHLTQYRDMTAVQVPLSVPLEDVLLIEKYRFRDAMILRIRTENIEMSKSQHLLNAIDAELPTKQVDKEAAISAAVTRRTTALNTPNN